MTISDDDLAEVRRLVEQGKLIPAAIVRAIIARLDEAEERTDTRNGRRTKPHSGDD